MFDLESLKTIITFGGLALFALIFLYGFIVGVIRGRYKVSVRFVYVIVFMVLLAIFTPLIINGALNIQIPFGIDNSVKGFIQTFIENDETIKNIVQQIPSLEPIMFQLIISVVSPLLYILFVWIGLIISAPIYWSYLGFVKLIIKRPKYETKFGELVRNDKNKKVKIRYKKHRLVGGLIRGTQAVFVFSIILMPINLAVRLYNTAKDETGNSSVSLCESVTFLNDQQQICDYIEMYNNTFLGKVGKYNFIDEALFKSLSVMRVNGETYNLENELKAILRAGINLSNSGIIDMAMSSDFDIDTFDFTTLNMVEFEKAVDSLLSSKMFSSLVVEGVNYVLDEYAVPEIKNFLDNGTLVLDLSYSKATFKTEVGIIVDILKIVIDNNMIGLKDADFDDPLSIKSKVSEANLKQLIDKILDIKIGQALIPHVLEKYLSSYGYSVPTTLVNWENEKGILKDAITFLYTIDSFDPEILIDNLSKSQLMLLGSSLGKVSNSVLLGNVLPFLIEDLFVTYLSEFNFDTSALATLDWEGEFEDVADSVMDLKESGLLTLLVSGDLSLENIEVADLDFDLIKSSLNHILDTDFISSLLLEAINYGIEGLRPSLADLIGEESSTIELSYTLPTLKQDINSIVDLMEIVVGNGLLQLDIASLDGINGITSQISETTLKNLVDGLLDVNVTKKMLPHLVFNFLGEYGATQLTSEEINLIDWNIEKQILKDAISLVYVLDISSLGDQEQILNQLTNENITIIGGLLDNLTNSAMLNNILPTALNMVIGSVLEDFSFDEQIINDVVSWETELMTIKNLLVVFDEYSTTSTIDYTSLSTVLDDVSQSELMMSLMPVLASFAAPLLGDSIVIPEDTDWDVEIGYIKVIVNNLENIGQLADIGIDMINNDIKRTALGNIVDAAMNSQILGTFVSDTLIDLINPMMSDFGIELLSSDIDGVTSWTDELNNIHALMEEFLVEDNGSFSLSIPEFNTATITSLLDKIEDIQLLASNRVIILFTAIEMAGFMNETELAKFKLIDKTTVDYSNEKTILLNIFAHDITTILSSLDFTTLDPVVFGDIMNNVYGNIAGQNESLLLKGYIEDKVLGLMPSIVGIDAGDLEMVTDWEEELTYITNIMNNNFDINDFNSFDIATASPTDINNVASLINEGLQSVLISDYIALEMQSILASNDINKTISEIKDVSDWVAELELIKDMLTIDETSDSSTIATLFTSIENSQLLSSEKERILLEIAKKIDSSIVVTTLSAQEYLDEKAMLLQMIDSKDLLDSLSDSEFSFETQSDVDLQTLGSLLDAASQSLLFKDKVETSLRSAFTSAGIDFSGTLSDGTPWGNELILLKNITNLVDTIDDTITQEDLEALLNDLGSSIVLEEDKWKILQEIVDAIGMIHTVDENDGTWEDQVASIIEAYELM